LHATRRARAARQMAVQDAPAFHIFYATGWRDAVLRVRTLDADGAPQTPARRCGERLGQLAVQGFYAAGV